MLLLNAEKHSEPLNEWPEAFPAMVYLLVTTGFSGVALTVHSYVFQVQMIGALHIWIKPLSTFKLISSEALFYASNLFFVQSLSLSIICHPF